MPFRFQFRVPVNHTELTLKSQGPNYCSQYTFWRVCISTIPITAFCCTPTPRWHDLPENSIRTSSRHQPTTRDGPNSVSRYVHGSRFTTYERLTYIAWRVPSGKFFRLFIFFLCCCRSSDFRNLVAHDCIYTCSYKRVLRNEIIS